MYTKIEYTEADVFPPRRGSVWRFLRRSLSALLVFSILWPSLASAVIVEKIPDTTNTFTHVGVKFAPKSTQNPPQNSKLEKRNSSSSEIQFPLGEDSNLSPPSSNTSSNSSLNFQDSNIREEGLNAHVKEHSPTSTESFLTSDPSPEKGNKEPSGYSYSSYQDDLWERNKSEKELSDIKKTDPQRKQFPTEKTRLLAESHQGRGQEASGSIQEDPIAEGSHENTEGCLESLQKMPFLPKRVKEAPELPEVSLARKGFQDLPPNAQEVLKTLSLLPPSYTWDENLVGRFFGFTVAGLATVGYVAIFTYELGKLPGKTIREIVNSPFTDYVVTPGIIILKLPDAYQRLSSLFKATYRSLKSKSTYACGVFLTAAGFFLVAIPSSLLEGYLLYEGEKLNENYSHVHGFDNPYGELFLSTVVPIVMSSLAYNLPQILEGCSETWTWGRSWFYEDPVDKLDVLGTFLQSAPKKVWEPLAYKIAEIQAQDIDEDVKNAFLLTYLWEVQKILVPQKKRTSWYDVVGHGQNGVSGLLAAVFVPMVLWLTSTELSESWAPHGLQIALGATACALGTGLELGVDGKSFHKFWNHFVFQEWSLSKVAAPVAGAVFSSLYAAAAYTVTQKLFGSFPALVIPFIGAFVLKRGINLSNGFYDTYRETGEDVSSFYTGLKTLAYSTWNSDVVRDASIQPLTKTELNSLFKASVLNQVRKLPPEVKNRLFFQ